MKKLKLDLERLDVASFPTTPNDAPPAGTVHAAEDMPHTRELYCTKGDTCFTSCGGGGHCTCPI